MQRLRETVMGRRRVCIPSQHVTRSFASGPSLTSEAPTETRVQDRLRVVVSEPAEVADV